jgi:ribosomal protein L9
MSLLVETLNPLERRQIDIAKLQITVLNRNRLASTSQHIENTCEVEATKTWYPVRHRDVLTCVEETLDKSGFQIRKSQLSVSNNNHRFFGVLDIEAPLADGVTLSVGVRNSNDRHLRMRLVLRRSAYKMLSVRSTSRPSYKTARWIENYSFEETTNEIIVATALHGGARAGASGLAETVARAES